MDKFTLTGLIIRTGVVRSPEVGYILACDPKLEWDEISHTISFKWSSGQFNRGSLNFSAHTCCFISSPELALVTLSGAGNYSISSSGAKLADNIYKASYPPSTQKRFGDMRWVTEIAGKAYAVGHSGSVYRLDDFPQWTRIDEELPRNFNIESIHGFNASDIYAVGKRGELWHFDGQNWTSRLLPTNVNLSRIKCAGDGTVYIAGHGGMLLRGRDRVWSVIDHEKTTDDLWAVEWFDGRLYVSTMAHVYYLSGETLELVDFGDDRPKTCYHLSVANDIMWSIGEEDILSFDRKKWVRIV